MIKKSILIFLILVLVHPQNLQVTPKQANSSAQIQADQQQRNESLVIFQQASGFGPEIKCQNKNCSRHWVFALDKSGSMTGTKWEKLLQAMDSILPYIETLGFQYVSVFKFDSQTHPVVEHINPNDFQSEILGLPGGGTNFGRPLRRAIDIISRWSQENTCYVMLTDGLASYPHEELLLFDSFKKNIESEGYDFCTICYFIKATPNTEPPSAFTRMCSAFNGDFQQIEAENLEQQFTYQTASIAYAQNARLVSLQGP